MILSDILNHPKFRKSKRIPKRINRKITGRVCMTDHLHALYIIRELLGDKCKTYLEIGTLFGGSMLTVMESEYKTRFIGIDIFNYYGQELDPNTDVPVSLGCTRQNIIKHNRHHHIFYLIKSDSRKCISGVERWHSPIDFLFIDGDHSKSGVMADFNNYSSFVPVGGIIVFDDYGNPAWRDVKVGVDELDLSDWDMVGRYGHLFIIERMK